MTAKKVNPTNFITDEVTFSYVNLFEPKVNQSGDLKYSVCILLDMSNKKEKKRWDAAINAAIEGGIQKGKFTANQRPILKMPIRNGSEELATEVKKGLEYKDRWFINANANPSSPPGITKPNNGIAVPITDPLEFYSGCKGRAIISFYPYSSNGSKGVAVGINGVYKTKEGDRLDGRVDAVSVFNQFAEADSEGDEQDSEFE